MKQLKAKLLAGLLSVAMVLGTFAGATCAWTGNVHAQSRGCSGLAEKDVYYPEKEDVVPDPILNWAIRSAMKKMMRSSY